jgi:hypothetical protein
MLRGPIPTVQANVAINRTTRLSWSRDIFTPKSNPNILQ